MVDFPVVLLVSTKVSCLIYLPYHIQPSNHPTIQPSNHPTIQPSEGPRKVKSSSIPHLNLSTGDIEIQGVLHIHDVRETEVSRTRWHGSDIVKGEWWHQSMLDGCWRVGRFLELIWGGMSRNEMGGVSGNFTRWQNIHKKNMGMLWDAEFPFVFALPNWWFRCTMCGNTPKYRFMKPITCHQIATTTRTHVAAVTVYLFKL